MTATTRVRAEYVTESDLALWLAKHPVANRCAEDLRQTCANYRIDPPSLADFRTYFLLWLNGDGAEDWLDDYIDAGETAAGERCQAIFGRLDRYARLEDATAQAVADTSEDARFASCDPCVLVMVTHDGSAIVADFAGADVQVFEPQRSRRERRAQRARERRTYCRDRRLQRDARRALDL